MSLITIDVKDMYTNIPKDRVIKWNDVTLIIWEGSIKEIKKLIEELTNIETGLQFKEEIG